MKRRTLIDPHLKRFTRDLKEKIGSYIKAIYLFGSRARGDNSEESDYDIIVLVRTNPEKVESIVDDLTYQYLEKEGVMITAFVEREGRYIKDKYEPLFVNIHREGIAL